jgi:hypothetical protein
MCSPNALSTGVSVTSDWCVLLSATTVLKWLVYARKGRFGVGGGVEGEAPGRPVCRQRESTQSRRLLDFRVPNIPNL